MHPVTVPVDPSAPTPAHAIRQRLAQPPGLDTPGRVVATAVALMLLGYGAALMTALGASPLLAAALGVAPVGLEATAPVAYVGGTAIGLVLTAHVLHGGLARPLDPTLGPHELGGPRYAYSPSGRRRMTLGLGAAYATAAVAAVVLVSVTPVTRPLQALFAY